MEHERKQKLIAENKEIIRKAIERKGYLTNKKERIEQYLEKQRKVSFEEWQSQFLKKYQQNDI